MFRVFISLTTKITHQRLTNYLQCASQFQKVNIFFKKSGPIPASFSLFSSFLSTVDSKQIFIINIFLLVTGTADLWYRKQLLYQLSHTTTAKVVTSNSKDLHLEAKLESF